MLDMVVAHKFMLIIAVLVGVAYYAHSKNPLHAVVAGLVTAVVLKLVNVDARLGVLLKRV